MIKLLQHIYKQRSKYYSNLIINYIKKDEKVLDIGAGSGYIAEIISKKADVTLLDIKNYNQTKLPLKIYDGEKIPFKDNSFDTAMIITVFHYFPQPVEFLKEAKRVCRRIILVDDVYKTKLEKLIVHFNDTMVSNTVGIFTKFNFHKDEEFKSIFQNLNLRLIESTSIRSFLRITKQNIYVIEK